MERADHQRRVTWVSLVGLVLVPVLVAAGFLWATWGAGDRLHRVDAAVVNQDEAVKLNGQLVPLGRQLAGGLVDSDEENFSWKLVDAQEGRRGLADGRYAAVVTIPKNFSKAATSYAGEAGDARQATIEVKTSDLTGISDAAVSQQITNVARERLNTTLTETYLDNIYLGFNKTQEQFEKVAEGADKLATGSTELSNGVSKASDGAEQLTSGLSQLSTAGGQLRSGGSALSAGYGQFDAGLQKLAPGVVAYTGGVHQLTEGSRQLASGTGQLATGAQQYADGVRSYTGGVHQVAGGAQQLSEGIDALNAGLTVAPLTTAQRQQLDGLATGMQGATDGAAGLSAGLQQYHDALPGVAGQVAGGVAAQGCAQYQQAPNRDELCAAFTAGAQAGSAATAQAAQQGLSTPDPATGQSLLSGLKGLSDGLAQLNPGVQALVAQVKAMPEQLAQLKAGVEKLAVGAQQYAAGVAELDKASPKIVFGADQLATGAGQLSAGSSQFAIGMGKLDAGSGPLASGVTQLAAGSGELGSGVRQYTSGVGQYTDGVTKAADGSKQFASGMVQLNDGTAELAQGARTFSDELAKGASQIPTYDEAERTNLKTTAANPVSPDSTAPQTDLSQVPSTTLLMVLALWLGAMATFVVIQAVSTRTLLSSRPSWRLVAQALAPGVGVVAIQALAVTAVGQIVLGLSIGTVFAVLALLLFGGLVFVCVNHALVAWLGGFGRMLSIGAVVLVAAGAISSAIPAGLESVLPMLPMTPLLNAVRTVVTDSGSTSGSINGDLGQLLLWLIGAFVLSTVAVVRRRTISPAQLRLRYA